MATKEDGITAYCHCRQCINELPRGISPMDFADLSVGLTEDGDVRVWCNRHDREVVTYPIRRPS